MTRICTKAKSGNPESAKQQNQESTPPLERGVDSHPPVHRGGESTPPLIPHTPPHKGGYMGGVYMGVHPPTQGGGVQAVLSISNFWEPAELVG